MIVVDQVTKYYGSHPAVQDLDFRIEEGECVGFLGLNGAGKTTILRLLSCLLLPTSGRVTIRGLDAEEQPHEIRKLIGFLPDTPPVYTEMTVASYLRFAGKLRGMSGAEIKKRLPRVIDTCALRDVADQSIGTLSHGYRQRVGIAQAIVHRPALLILDEPIQGLDPVQIVEMREMIKSLRGQHTILLSTHILSEIEQTCDRILMLHRGRIAAQGSEEDLVSSHGDRSLIALEVRPGDVDVHRALNAVDEVTDIEPGDQDNGIVNLRVRARGDVREALARAVVESGAGLLRMERLSTGLEAIFVQLSKSETSDASAAVDAILGSKKSASSKGGPAKGSKVATEPAKSAEAAKPSEEAKPSGSSSDESSSSSETSEKVES